MEADTSHIGVLFYTHNRIEDARINMEIVRYVWSSRKALRDAVIVHVFNGSPDWWETPHLEDEFVTTENPSHYAGAALAIDRGLEVFANKYPDIRYVVILASDTWCVAPHYLEATIIAMEQRNKRFATCAWGTNQFNQILRAGAAIDFCIVDLPWANQTGFTPWRYQEFKDKYGEAVLYQYDTIKLERVVALRFKQAVERAVPLASENQLLEVASSLIAHMREREPIHVVRNGEWSRIMYQPAAGIIGHHNPEEKRDVLREWKIPLGPAGTRFLKERSLEYFNRHSRGRVYANGVLQTEVAQEN